MKSLKFYCVMQFIDVLLPLTLSIDTPFDPLRKTIDVSPGFHINEPVINFSALNMVLIIVKP